ncbi:MAG: class I SAM-dependent methyltransferase [Oligoflexia bacterium]|nr:class I SAM-dependent methyltransferase [Oligoflexia bacterium]MBF0365137.1 class I SAM-dependent methyltransferase [Oligoflexia bacterium]
MSKFSLSDLSLLRFLASQLQKPRGNFGKLLMTKLFNFGNAQLINATLISMDLHADDCYLDVGVASGKSIKIASSWITTGSLYGIDYSSEMIEYCKKNFPHSRCHFVHTDAAHLPFADCSFSKISTINTIYFWENPMEMLLEIRRVLKSSGTFALSFSGKAKMNKFSAVTKHGFFIYDGEQIETLMVKAGFSEIHRQDFSGKFIVPGDHIIIAKK